MAGLLNTWPGSAACFTHSFAPMFRFCRYQVYTLPHHICLALVLWRCIICFLAQAVSSSPSCTSKRLTKAFLDNSFCRPSYGRDGLLTCRNGITSWFDIAARLGGYSIFLGLTLRSPAKRVISEVRPISDFMQRPCPDRDRYAEGLI